MSLFDVIKYPISDPPTTEEFKALPSKLFSKWCKYVMWYEHELPVMANYYSMNSSAPRVVEELSVLRKMIRDYDEHI